MRPDIKTLCQYRLDRAKEDLLAAETNQQTGLYKAATNRSYYAIFHSIVAN
ncbi:MAG: HEPN domain-containing protein [Lachnospiraceae bacterium]|nr:HEPN domain-containing protein [Lachnospiraceae bacterium]